MLFIMCKLLYNKNMSNFYDEIFKMKNIIRRGWQLRIFTGERLESDAEHTFSCCLLALKIIEDRKLDLNTEKVLKMMLFHELGEIDVGDITPVDKITKEEKFRREKIAIERIAKVFEMPEILSLWLEFEENKTAEAQFCKMLDKLDAVMQSKVYSNEQNSSEPFTEFYNNALNIIENYRNYCE